MYHSTGMGMRNIIFVEENGEGDEVNFYVDKDGIEDDKIRVSVKGDKGKMDILYMTEHDDVVENDGVKVRHKEGQDGIDDVQVSSIIVDLLKNNVYYKERGIIGTNGDEDKTVLIHYFYIRDYDDVVRRERDVLDVHFQVLAEEVGFIEDGTENVKKNDNEEKVHTLDSIVLYGRRMEVH